MLAGLGEQLTNAEIAARMYRVGAHRRVPRVVAAAQAACEQPSRARTAGGACRCDVDGRQRHDRAVWNGHLPVHRCRGLDCVVGAVPIVDAGGAGPPRRRRAGRDHGSPRPHLHHRRRRVRRRLRVGAGGCRCCGRCPAVTGVGVVAGRHRRPRADGIAQRHGDGAKRQLLRWRRQSRRPYRCDRARGSHPVVGGDRRSRRRRGVDDGGPRPAPLERARAARANRPPGRSRPAGGRARTACRPRWRRQPAAPGDHVDRARGRVEPTGRHGRHAPVGDRHRNRRGGQDTDRPRRSSGRCRPVPRRHVVRGAG